MITLEMIAEGMEHGDIAIVDSPHGDGAVCQIGEYTFYFGGQTAEDMSAAEYLADVPEDDVVKEILGALEDFRHVPDFTDEYGYYEAFLNEQANVRDSIRNSEGHGVRHRQNHRHRQQSR